MTSAGKIVVFSLFILALFVVINGQTDKKSPFWPLEERVGKMIDMSHKKPLMKLNPEKFKHFVGLKGFGQPVRNYSIVVMMTALSPMRQCSVCRQASDEFSIVANSWRYSPQFSPNLFFAYVDYDEGSDIFQQLGINSAPVFLYFPERSVRSTVFSMKAAEQMDIQRIGFAAETVGRWIYEKTNVQIRIIRPPNYTVTLMVFFFFTVVSCLLYVRRNNLEFLYNKTFWGMLSLAIVFAMTSGQMWSHIRSPPLMHRSAKGFSYIHGSSSGQFVIETYIIFALNAAITLGFILVIDSLKPNAKKVELRKYFSIAGIILIAVFFSLLLSIFRGKAHGYPYSFLFK